MNRVGQVKMKQVSGVCCWWRYDRASARNRLALGSIFSPMLAMGLPTQPVTLSVAQVEELNKELSTMRHDVNNYLSLILAAVELVKFKPEMAGRMMDNLAQQPPKVNQSIAKYSGEVERILGITRP